MREEEIIEAEFINKLQNDLKYTYREDIRDKESLELNFRKKFESLNRVKLTDAEFSRLKDEIISDDVFKASKTLRSKNTFTREDGTPLYYTLVNIKDWCKNDYEVVNQLRINTDNSHHRYDVIILINGIPVVQVELKSTKVNPRKAMEQIVEYKNDKGNGYLNSIMCFMQLFIVSNENDTRYFSNNNNHHFNFNADEQYLPIYKMANIDNSPILPLSDFSSAFLPKCTLGEMISRYMVLVATEQKILVMRPYQIYAVKKIIECIEDNRGNGYIWHTTGSGKTLTSFKTSTLLKDNLNVDKCLFVVDRKDLDRQTRDEFNKFQENCVEENTNTDSLVKKMLSEDKDDKIIVTTIQKLGIALDPKQKKDYKSRLLPLQNKRIVFIFDECHRSQFGDNHEAIKEFFKNHQLFGFTGTPIFEENAVQVSRTGDKANFKVTKDIFPSLLHSYTITNAIEDNNVLRFHIHYFKGKGEKEAAKNITLPKEKIVENIIEKHNGATNGRKFNALFATSSINDAIEYHKLFKKKQEELTITDGYEPLNIACVFSPPAGLSADAKQMQEDLENEREDYKQDPEGKKQALINIIDDYNKQYDTNHTINDFDAYYQDVQQRIKDQKYSNEDYAHSNKVDIVIVVDMLLTGFDSKYLNTLYVDKQLKYHGLIQAFSRTNRVLNDSKPAGNILDYRGQQDAVDVAIKRFSQDGEDPDKVRKIWLVNPAPAVIEDYEKAVIKLQQFMKSQGIECTAEAAQNLNGTAARAEFVQCFKEVQRHRTQLDQYTDLSDEQQEFIEQLMPEKENRAFKGAYIEAVKRLRVDQGRNNGADRDKTLDELDFELVLFASATIDYDYIMRLWAKYQNSDPQTTRWEATRDELVALIASSANLMDEKDDIIEYLDSHGEIRGLSEKELKDGYKQFIRVKSQKVIRKVADRHSIDYDSLQSFVDNIITLMRFDDSKLTELLSPLGLGWKARTQKKLELMTDLIPELEKAVKGRNDEKISGLSVYDEK